MPAITTRNGPKPFAWSYSKLKNFESCPKRHFHVDVAKDVKEEESEALTWGNEVHKHLANRIGKNIPLPASMKSYEKWCERILSGVTRQGNILVEQKLAITSDFGPCGYFDRNVWFRGVGDVVNTPGKVALIVDWKTGKILEDSQQLFLMAACVFAHYPEVVACRSEYIWLKEDAHTSEVFLRKDMHETWARLLPRVELLKNAYETNCFPAKPGALCRRWCPVEKCPHYGE